MGDGERTQDTQRPCPGYQGGLRQQPPRFRQATCLPCRRSGFREERLGSPGNPPPNQPWRVFSHEREKLPWNGGENPPVKPG